MLSQPLKGSSPPLCSLPNSLPKGKRLYTCLHPHGEHLSQGCLNNISGAIVDKLGNCSTTYRPNIICRVSDRIQHWFAAIKHIFIATYPNCKVTTGSTSRATTYRSIQDMYSTCCSFFMYLSNHPWRAGTKVKINFVSTHSLHNSKLTKGYSFNLCRARK